MTNIVEKETEVKYFRLKSWNSNSKRFTSVKVPTGYIDFCEDNPMGVSNKYDIEFLLKSDKLVCFDSYEEAVVPGSELAEIKGITKKAKKEVKEEQEEEKPKNKKKVLGII